MTYKFNSMRAQSTEPDKPVDIYVIFFQQQQTLLVCGLSLSPSKDPFWRLLVTYCARNGAYRGCELPALDVDSSLLDDGQVGSGRQCPC